eukprot:1160291-Pelagomonas_calceolata.AAC.3
MEPQRLRNWKPVSSMHSAALPAQLGIKKLQKLWKQEKKRLLPLAGPRGPQACFLVHAPASPLPTAPLPLFPLTLTWAPSSAHVLLVTLPAPPPPWPTMLCERRDRVSSMLRSSLCCDNPASLPAQCCESTGMGSKGELLPAVMATLQPVPACASIEAAANA